MPVTMQCQYISELADGRRNKHGIPLRKLFIFGRAGLPELRGWVREWLK